MNVLLGFCLLAGTLKAQVPIPWNSPPQSANLTSSGQAMDSTFMIELGVFTGSFVPTPSNLDQWEENWNPADKTGYNAVNSLFTAVHQATGNSGPFTAGKAAYLWGKRPGQGSDEWILFRAASWTWPDASFPSPALDPWQADSATAVIGSINASGSPFLMQTASVPNNTPPLITWAQWQSEELKNVAENGANDDPDEDGVPNLMEFAFGSHPLVRDSGPALPVTQLHLSGASYLSMRVPKPVDRAVELIVQVSSDLQSWHEGPDHTVLVEDGAESMVFRDKTPVGSHGGSRFIRLAVRLPEE